MRYFRFVVAPCLCFLGVLITGCGEHMAFDSGERPLNTQTKSIGFFTLTVKNGSNPAYGLAPAHLSAVSDSGTITNFVLAGDWQGKGSLSSTDLTYTATSEFPVSLALARGRYTIGEVSGGGGNILLAWIFKYPLNAKFDLPPGSVVYLGHVIMTNRQRKDGEQRSGSIFPLIDQGVSGLAGGTMDIDITDQSSIDVPKFVAKYPALSGVPVATSIMTKK